MAKYIEDRRDGEMFLAGNLESLLPEESVARGIWKALEGMDFRDFDERYRNDDTGRPAVDPRQLVGVWMLAMTRGVGSAVQVARLAGTDVEFRWMLGDVRVEKSTLSEFRKAGGERLKGLTAQVLMALVGCGLVQGEVLGVDGTMVEAAASRQSNRSRKQLKKQWEKLQERIEREWSREEEDSEGEEERRRLQRRRERLERMLGQMAALGEDDKVTLTEPEAKLRKMKDGRFRPGYNVQVVNDLSSGVIVHADVVPGGNDKGQLEERLKEAVQELRPLLEPEAPDPLAPVKAVATDAQYHETGPLMRLEEQGIDCYVPEEAKRNRTPPGVGEGYRAEAFRYDEANDVMVCPQGQALRWRGLTNEKTGVKYEGRAAVCRVCAQRWQCCPNSKTGRTVNRSLYEAELKTIAERVRSSAGRWMSKARWVTLEGCMGRLKERLNWKRCRMWGKRGAKAELAWRQLTHNLMLLIGAWQPLVVASPMPRVQ